MNAPANWLIEALASRTSNIVYVSFIGDFEDFISEHDCASERTIVKPWREITEAGEIGVKPSRACKQNLHNMPISVDLIN